MVNRVSWERYLGEDQSNDNLLVDVRSPTEFELGNIPGAINIPLFDDDERARVGVTYKNNGQEAAVRVGLGIVGPKTAAIVKEVDALTTSKKIAVHCWRGGMRSDSIASLLTMAGYSVSLLEGGYKAYRNLVLEQLGEPWDIRILSGRTGSGKTEILLAMQKMGAQVVDLEGLANHKGSAFGGLLQPPQPSQQNFEHALFNAFRALDPKKPIWLEDESLSIGRVYIPQPLWKNKMQSIVTVIDMDIARRVKRLVSEYAGAPDEGIRTSLLNIQKRLGGQHVQAALVALEAGDFAQGAHIALQYYDRAYDKGLQKRETQIVRRLDAEQKPIEKIAAEVLVK